MSVEHSILTSPDLDGAQKSALLALYRHYRDPAPDVQVVPGVAGALPQAPTSAPLEALDPQTLSGFTVYRLYDAQGVLLYIGQSTHLARRLGQHQTSSIFGPQIAHVRYESCPDKRSMDRRETELIRLHQPPYNTVGTSHAVNPGASRAEHERRALADAPKGLGVFARNVAVPPVSPRVTV